MRNGRGMAASYNIMKPMVIPRVVSLSIGLASMCCISCGQSDGGVVETRRTATPTTAVSSPPTTPASAPRIVFLGDSLTAGYGLAKEESVPSLIEAHLKREGYGYEVVNAGVSGDTSAGGLSRFDWSLDGDVKVYSGHGPVTTIGEERLTNPFLTHRFI